MSESVTAGPGNLGAAPANPQAIDDQQIQNNPLRDARDRRIPRVAGPVRAGHVRGHRRPGPQEAAAGHLRPGQPGPAAPGLLAGRLRPAGLGARGLRPAHLRGGQGARPDPVPGDRVAPGHGGHPVRPGRVRRRPGLRRAGPVRLPAGRRAQHRRQLRLLPVHPAQGVPGRGAAAEAVRPVRPGPLHPAGRPGGLGQPPPVAPGGDREAVRPRPEERPRAERHPERGVPARVGVPHRPLPGQGDGPEHPGPALRQLAVRADLEPRLRRPRADHHGRGHRHRRPGRLLRRHRRGPGRDPEPPAPAAGADRDGRAGGVRRRLAAGREGEGTLGRAAARPTWPPAPPAASTPRAGRAASRSGASWRRTASRRTPGPRPTPRSGSGSAPGAGPGSRSTCAPASGCRAG